MRCLARGAVALLIMFSAEAHATDSVCPGALTDLKAAKAGLGVKSFELQPGESAEGGKVNVYVDRHGKPRFVSVQQYGETGKSTMAYALVDGASAYQAEVSQDYYAAPISQGSTKIVREELSRFLVCGRNTVPGVGAQVDKNLAQEAQRVLELALGKYGAGR